MSTLWITIYALCNPKTGECRYVGKAKDLPYRLRSHRWEAKNPKYRTHKVRWLRSLGCDPLVEVLEVVSEDKWEERERYWIAKLRKKGCRLTNFADGGQTSPVEGVGHSEATKQKLRESALRRGVKPPSRKGTKISEETRAKQRIAHAGRIPPPMGGWNKGILKSVCKNGHKFTPRNTRISFRDNRQYQVCKTCIRLANRRYSNKHRKAG